MTEPAPPQQSPWSHVGSSVRSWFIAVRGGRHAAQAPRQSEPEAPIRPKEHSQAWHRRRRKSITRAVLAGLLTLILWLAGDAVLASRQMLNAITAARAALQEGAAAVIAGDPSGARRSFEEAREAAAEVEAAASRPAVAIAGRLPIAADNVEAVLSVARAAALTADAGDDMVAAAEAMAWTDLKAPGIASLGSIEVDLIKAGLPHVRAASVDLTAALEELERIHGRLIGPVRAGVHDAVDQTERRIALAASLRNAGALLPQLYGVDRAHRYLLAFQSLGMPRSSGGIVDMVGELRAEGGELSLAKVAPAPDGLDEALREAVPAANPALAAQALLPIAEEFDLGKHQGVFLIDSGFLEDLLWMTGDVEGAGAQPVLFEDVARLIEKETFLGTNPHKAAELRARLLGDLVAEALERAPSMETLGTGFGQTAAERHLAIFLTARKQQRLVHRLGADGEAPLGRTPLAIAWNGLADNRAGSFAAVAVRHVVGVDSAGTARVKTIVTMRNTAPAEPASLLLGRPLGPNPDPIGYWAADLALTLPIGSENIGVETSSPSDTRVLASGEYPVALATMDADPEQQITATVAYRRPEAATDEDGTSVFVLRIVPTPTYLPARVVVQFRLPPQAEVVSTSEGIQTGTTTLRWSGAPTAPVELEVRYR